MIIFKAGQIISNELLPYTPTLFISAAFHVTLFYTRICYNNTHLKKVVFASCTVSQSHVKLAQHANVPIEASAAGQGILAAGLFPAHFYWYCSLP